MWSTTASTVSTVADSNAEKVVNGFQDKHICGSKPFYYPVVKLTENCYRRIIGSPFVNLIEFNTNEIRLDRSIDVRHKRYEIDHQNNICYSLQNQYLNRNQLDLKLKSLHPPPCTVTKCYLTDYYNYPKLIVEIPGYKTIKADEILSIVRGKLMIIHFISKNIHDCKTSFFN